MAYSNDLREKIVRAVDEGVGSQRAIAELFGVSRSFVEKLLARRRTSGSIAPRPHGGGRKPRCAAQDLIVVRRLVKEQPDVTLDELRERVAAERALSISRATMGRLLGRLGLPRKKSLHAAERDTPRVREARTLYRELIATLDLARFKFIDEAGSNLAMTRAFGRAPRGVRVSASVPLQLRRKHHTARRALDHRHLCLDDS